VYKGRCWWEVEVGWVAPGCPFISYSPYSRVAAPAAGAGVSLAILPAIILILVLILILILHLGQAAAPAARGKGQALGYACTVQQCKVCMQ